MIRTCLDEPEYISVIQTKLQVLEEMLFDEPDFYTQEELRHYVENLQGFVRAVNTLPPECLNRIK
jgi:hypothetical protein